MSHVLARALTLSATHFVDGQLLNYDADEVYPRLKTLSSEGNCLLASQVRDFPINPDYRNLTVTELVERIELTATQMVAFGELMLEAAHAGLVEAACEDELDSDASAWHLPSFAEARI
ncbi:TPA: hypothetical protein L6A34_31535 [Pseudomonas aeruginosa]|jgi:hypothetical protein|uniref:hypothetical protein n=1 Tax=Pseudomonas aeruginosa TaxID=287 RepID=UPI00070DA21C|nr:hypothetical protein [Pseudomonas aeruginosa]ELQ8317613.1 hypothetical protein [Pseudomonas aeruginosa]KSM65142.1 hypothetical protein APA70_22375 [Pseudomonas aeruginosa]HBP5961617.1 hypothetical protein [Pseudomonas aeruginosa]HBP6298978.1 hypothetical protein [Pseudomonas aeruginosa]HBP6386452.1 hypothetical protein [Pseudomonas aeruginosa]